jgi:hypothetical protein
MRNSIHPRALGVLFVVALVALVSASPLRADWCRWEDSPPSGYVFVCYPEYYTIMTTQPDWTLYADGDVVYVRLTFTPPSTWAETGWFVKPASDSTTPSPFSVYRDCEVFEGELYCIN